MKRFAGDLFKNAIWVVVGLVIAVTVLNFARRKFSGNVVGSAAAAVEHAMTPSA